MLTALEEQLIRHEGYRDRPYEDSVGVLTIGIGHNLEAHPVKKEIIMEWFREDITEAVEELMRAYPWVGDIKQERREVFINMVFNLGLPRFSGFRKMLKHAEKGEWEEAADQALDSKWAKQVGGRAIELSYQLRSGERA